MKRIGIILAAGALLTLVVRLAYSESVVERDTRVFSTVYTAKSLYTNPDLSQGGGLKGEIVTPKTPVRAIFALPPHEPRFVYKGVLSGPDNHNFEFVGLPAAKYDLFIVYDNDVYEGLTLNRYKNTLTDADRKAIEYIINKSDPFFEKKVVNRLSGVTGKKKGKARAIACMIRLGPTTDMPGNNYTSHKCNIKYFFLEDVGPGYQVARSRDIFSRFVENGKEVPKWNYRPYLAHIRVTDSIKNLGKIDLSIPGEAEELPDPVEEIDPGSSVPVESESTGKTK